MRILYGIQGTGNGHLARARSLLPELLSAGIEVDCVFSGRAREEFFDMGLFGDYRCLRGFTLVVEAGKLNPVATFRNNSLLNFLREVRNLQVNRYDLVISDFEPVTAWAAKLAGKPSLGISHQNAFCYAVPKVRGYAASRLLMRCFAPVNQALGLHWHHFNAPVLPLLIEAHHLLAPVANKVVVYMGFEAIEHIVQFLQPFTDTDFYVFARVPEPEVRGHIHLQPLSHREFHRHLEDCTGVISNAGFELASECLALGKKLLVKPLAGQYEQLSNALALQALSRATVIEDLDQVALAQWLQLPAHTPIHYPPVGLALAQWIRRGCTQSVEELAATLWSESRLAYTYDASFGKNIIADLVF